MRKDYKAEFLYHVAALLVAIVVVHGFYVLVVRPKADEILANRSAAMQADPSYVQERSGWVDRSATSSRRPASSWPCGLSPSSPTRVPAPPPAERLLDDELVPAAEGTKILPEDAREYARQIEAMPPERRGSLLPRALLTALQPVHRHPQHPGCLGHRQRECARPRPSAWSPSSRC